MNVGEVAIRSLAERADRHLGEQAPDTVLKVTAQDLAESIGRSKESVQTWGRKGDKKRGRWLVTYSRGVFAVRQRPDYEPPREYPAPDWFEAPVEIETRARHWSSFDVGQRHCLAYHFARQCVEGSLALAPWQRASVWDERQRIDLLDSMIRGLSIGAITIWNRPWDADDPKGRPIAGCADPQTGADLIVDGQQRATTLVMAALGELDHWRWNGSEWTQGPGFLTPKIAVMDMGWMGWEEWQGWGDAMLKLGKTDVSLKMWRQKETIERTDLDVMVLGGSAEEMIQTYRRLATKGSPHSPEDLAIMEEWAREHGIELESDR